MTVYSVGEELVPLHALCGRMWSVLRDGVVYCAIAGPRASAQCLVDDLNALVESVEALRREANQVKDER